MNDKIYPVSAGKVKPVEPAKVWALKQEPASTGLPTDAGAAPIMSVGNNSIVEYLNNQSQNVKYLGTWKFQVRERSLY